MGEWILRSVLAKGMDTPLRYHFNVVCPTDSDNSRVYGTRSRELCDPNLLMLAVTEVGSARYWLLEPERHRQRTLYALKCLSVCATQVYPTS